jgi:WD40 repeat protein
MDLLDFQAEITAAEHGVYEVTLRGPDGAETSSRTRLSLPPDQLRALVARIPDAVIASSARVRRSASPDEQPVQLLGHSLYETLTAGDGRALLASARHAAARAEARLRLVLRVRPPELALLPWEFLYDGAHSGYVCTTTPLIRHPQVPVPQRPLKVGPPLRVLCMTARPGDQESLAVESERHRLGAALEGLRRDGLIELGWVGGETWRDLRAALRKESGPWHVFHFIGHGGFDRTAGEGTLALDDGAGGTYQLGAENLAMVLQGHPSLRLVVLNACETGRASAVDPFSSVGGALMRAGLPAALVMQYPISDQAAVEFGHSFYEELAQGRTVDAAVTEARQSVRLALPGTLEWGTPVLYMRSLDGMLFAIGRERAPQARATQVGDLFVQGLAALYTHRWDDAVAAFRAVLAEERGYQNAAAKLEEALRGRRLDHLYTAARGAMDAGQWDDAVAHLSTILTEDPDYRDAREHLDAARTQSEVASLRSEARALHAAAQWEAVLAVGERLAGLVPDDPDPDGVVGEARRRARGVPEEGVPEPDRQEARSGGESGRARAVPLFMTMEAWSVSFAPDGGHAAVGGARGQWSVLSLEDWQSRAVRPAALATAFAVASQYRWRNRRNEGAARALAFSPDGRRIATGNGSNVMLLDLRDTLQFGGFGVGRYEVTALAFCGAGLLAAASHHTVGLWSLDRPTRLRTLAHEDAVYALAVTRDATCLATAGHSSIRVWDVDTGEPTQRIDYHPMVFAADFSPDGTRLVTGALDHTARVWDTSTGDCLTRIELPDRVRGVAYGPDGDTLALAAGHTVTLLNLATGRRILELGGDSGEFGDVSLLQIAYSPAGTHLATVGGGKAWLIPIGGENR